MANRIARFLISNETRCIGLIMDRSFELYLWLFAAVKANCCYVPIDSSFDPEKIKYIVDNTSIQAVACHSKYVQKISCAVICVDDRHVVSLLGSFDSSNLDLDIDPYSLAYVLYTSGTTGVPKGVMINHANLGWYVAAAFDGFCLAKGDRVLQFASLMFDTSINDIGCAFYYRCALIIVPEHVFKDPAAELGAYSTKCGATYVDLVPSVQAVVNPSDFLTLRAIESAGEAVTAKLIRRWHEGHPALRYYNVYGPTETTVSATMSEDISRVSFAGTVPIGKPLPGVRGYILDSELRLVPLGAVGELYIGGPGVSVGYMNQPELTAKAFVDNPFHEGKMHKTGDWAKWTESLEIEYVGRKDRLVKLRGQRVDLGDVEAVILKLPEVKQARVQVERNRLLAFAVSATVTSVDLLKHLRKHLATYMIPEAVIVVENFPFTDRGKLDVPKLLMMALDSGRERTVPKGPAGVALAEIWKTLLKVDDVYMESSFFELGGYSLLASMLVMEVRKKFDIAMNLVIVFEKPLFSDMVTYIEMQKDGNTFILQNDPFNNSVSSGQTQMLAAWHKTGHMGVGNISMMVELQPNADVERVRKAIISSLERHPVLASAYSEDANGSVSSFRLKKHFDFDPTCDSYTAKEFLEKPFDLHHDFPMRCGLYHGNCLFIVFHHICIDAWGMFVFLKEIEDIYRDIPLDECKFVFSDSVYSQKQYVLTNLAALQQYWSEFLGHNPRPARLPRLSTSVTRDAKTKFVRVSGDLGSRLRDVWTSLKMTASSFLFGCLGLCLTAYMKESDFVVGLSSNYRTYTEAKSMIGYFVNTLPFRFKAEEKESVEGYLARVKTDVLQCLAHQDLPYTDIMGLMRENNVWNEDGDMFELIYNYVVSTETNFSPDSCFLKLHPNSALATPLPYYGFNVLVEQLPNDIWEIIFLYYPSQYDGDTVEKFGDDYLKCIELAMGESIMVEELMALVQ